jgi:hypothetical protein
MVRDCSTVVQSLVTPFVFVLVLMYEHVSTNTLHVYFCLDSQILKIHF